MVTLEDKIARVRAALRYSDPAGTFKNGVSVARLREIMDARDPATRVSAADFALEITATAAEKVRVLHDTLRGEDPDAVFRSSVRIDTLVKLLADEVEHA